MKALLRLTTALGLALATSTGAVAAAPVAGGEPQAAHFQQEHLRVTVAQAALHELVSGIAKHEGKIPMGFPLAVTDLQKLQRARVGFGYEEFHADPVQLKAGGSLEKSAHSSGTWRYAVTVDGAPVGLMTLVQDEGRWEVVGFSGADLSKEVKAVMEHHGATGAGLRFIRVLQARSDFIEVRDIAKSGGVRYVPLQAARESLQMKSSGGGLVSDSDFLPALREAVAQNMDTE